MARDLEDAPIHLRMNVGGRDLDPLEVPTAGASFKAGMTRGLGDRIMARAQAMGAQQGRVPELGRSLDPYLAKPIDEARFETDRAQNLAQLRQSGASARALHPDAYMVGEVTPAIATMLIPGAGEAKALGPAARLLQALKSGAALGGVQALAGSESDDPRTTAGETLSGAVLGAALGPLGEGLSQGVSALGRRLLPRAQGILGRAEQAIADRSAQALEGTARSAQGTAGAARANASRTVERLGMAGALPPAEQAANAAALATPEAEQLATALAQRARGELPEKLAQMQTADALAAQAAQDAASARSPEAVAAMEKQMRGEVVKRLATRYALPAAVGWGAGELTGGHGTLGALAGFGARPMMRATLRGLSSPAFAAPVGRMGVSLAERLMGAGGGEALAAAQPAVLPKLEDLLARLRPKSTPAVQFAEGGRDLE